MQKDGRRFSPPCPGVLVGILLWHSIAAGGSQSEADPNRGTAKRQGEPSPPNITEGFRALRDPLEARVSGRLYLALQAALEYRLEHQGDRLRASEKVVENFLMQVRTGPQSARLDKEEQDRCFEISFAPQITPGEEVALDQPEMKLGRYAVYVVCNPGYRVVRAGLGNEGLKKVAR